VYVAHYQGTLVTDTAVQLRTILASSKLGQSHPKYLRLKHLRRTVNCFLACLSPAKREDVIYKNFSDMRTSLTLLHSARKVIYAHVLRPIWWMFSRRK